MIICRTIYSYLSDIAEALDQVSTAVLIMLELSAAFDTIDHEILVSRFEQSFGITSKAMDWVKSYLTEFRLL